MNLPSLEKNADQPEKLSSMHIFSIPFSPFFRIGYREVQDHRVGIAFCCRGSLSFAFCCTWKIVSNPVNELVSQALNQGQYQSPVPATEHADCSP
ncbi:MAG: hypothetical protein ACI9R3_003994 [Verrucomicrobiales bacterium]|jgi:hypothetical protein